MRKESQASISENHIYIPSSLLLLPSYPAPMITLRERGGPYGFLISFFFVSIVKSKERYSRQLLSVTGKPSVGNVFLYSFHHLLLFSLSPQKRKKKEILSGEITTGS